MTTNEPHKVAERATVQQESATCSGMAAAKKEERRPPWERTAPLHRPPLWFVLGVLVVVGGAATYKLMPTSEERAAAEKERAAAQVVNGWLDAQRKGFSGARYWVDYSDTERMIREIRTRIKLRAGERMEDIDEWRPTRLFAVRDWEIVNNSGHTVVVRVESSTRGGQPISVLWNVYLKKNQFGELAIDSVSEVDYEKR